MISHPTNSLVLVAGDIEFLRTVTVDPKKILQGRCECGMFIRPVDLEAISLSRDRDLVPSRIQCGLAGDFLCYRAGSVVIINRRNAWIN